MNILITHNSLNSTGGGERVCLHIIKALMEAGHDVSLATVEKTNWNKVFTVMGIKLPRIPREYSLTRQLRMFGIYQRQLLFINVLRLRRKYDLIINTHGDTMIVPSDITYMHFPTIMILRGEWSPYVKYSKSLFWRAYFTPYELLLNFTKSTLNKTLLLTNSEFSKEIIMKYVNRDAIIVYPPVEIDDYLTYSENDDRDDAVIVISRFMPEKHLHLVPYVAKLLPKVKFYIIGSVRGFKSEEYFNKIVNLKNKLNINNLTLIPNAPHKVKLELLSKCKVLLHLYPYEHFGIVVVEGLASGCLPVVHQSGGQWIDIAEYGKYGFGYEKLIPAEIASKVKLALERWDVKLKEILIRRAKLFSDDIFRRKILFIVEKYYNM
ncbi:MAG: glycosyltransferase [archaeon GB-1867-005]|nr:glycosyltransferase [Candidatus Culexmicrobium cathedralense]